jgi:hypothetical protein
MNRAVKTSLPRVPSRVYVPRGCDVLAIKSSVHILLRDPSIFSKASLLPGAIKREWNLDLGGAKNAESLRCADPAGVYPAPEGPTPGGGY